MQGQAADGGVSVFEEFRAESSVEIQGFSGNNRATVAARRRGVRAESPSTGGRRRSRSSRGCGGSSYPEVFSIRWGGSSSA